jgi:uncharacterized membrane protein YbhN (UPF0104 family)
MVVRMVTAVAGIVILVALVGLWRGIDTHALLAVRVHWLWLVLAAVVNLLSILGKGIVWKTALEAVRVACRVGWRAVVSAMFVGFLVNTVLAARVGEVARVAVLRRRLRLEGVDVPFATIAGTVVAEQVVLGVGLILLVGVLTLTVPLPAWVGWGLLAVVAVVLIAGAALAVGAWSSRRATSPSARTRRSRLVRVIGALMAGQAVFARPGLAAIALSSSILSWLAQMLSISLTLAAFGLPHGLAPSALVFVASTLASLFPVLPASIGVFQGAVSVALVSAYGVTPIVGVAFAVALQLVEMVFGIGLGLVFLTREGLSLTSTRPLLASERAQSSG